MKAQLKAAALIMLLCSGVFWPPTARAAEQPGPSTAQRAREEAQQLLKERDEAQVKAKIAEQKMRDAGLRPESLGYESARATRNQSAAAGSKLAAYDRYARTTKEMEKRIKDEVFRGTRGVSCQDIARFESLQAEVDLARVAGRLPAEEK
jgi:hypothetical protein